jgi:hypothetical protein
VPVPEPGVWLLWFMGASLLIALTMSRRRVAGAAT